MPQSSYSHICYGIDLGEYSDFPWNKGEYLYSIDSWWVCGVLGYENTPETDDRQVLDLYFRGKFQFIKENPTPITLISYGSYEYENFIIALPHTVIANQDCPTSFNPEKLRVTKDDESKLLSFCSEYGINIGNKKPCWHLTSFID